MYGHRSIPAKTTERDAIAMPLTIPRPMNDPPKSTLPAGGSPALDTAYEVWRDNLLAEWSERLIARFFHSCCLDDLWPAWRFDADLAKRLDDQPLFEHQGHYIYSHRQRLLGVALKTNPARLLKIATTLLDSTDEAP